MSEPPHPRSVAPAADPVLSLVALKCLAKDPAGRYPSAVAVADDLERWAAGEPVSVRRPGLGRRVLGWARREPGLACRLAVIGLVAAIVHLKYRLDPAIGPAEQLGVMAVLAGWAVASALCQAVLRREWHAEGVVAAWLAADAAFLTALLALYVPHQTPLVMLYGLLVAASGVWFRVRLVWVSTAAALAGYAVLIGAAAARGAVTAAPHHHVICGIALVAIGTVVAYQVRRTRMLGSRPGATAGGSAAAESKNRRA